MSAKLCNHMIIWYKYYLYFLAKKNEENLFTWICCLMRSIATTFSAPLGTITSAYFLVGMTNSSNAGLTREVYWWRTCSRSRPCSSISRKTRLNMTWLLIFSNLYLPRQPSIRVCVHEQLQVEQFSNLWEVKDQDALDHHHVRWVYGGELSGYSGIRLEIIHRDLGWTALYNVLNKSSLVHF